MAQDPQAYVDDQGNEYVREGNRWRVIRPGQQAQAPAGPQAPAGSGYTIQPMISPAEQRAREEREYDRQRDTVRDDRADLRDRLAIESAARQAEAADRTAAKLTEDQGKAGGYARLMADAERSYQEALNQGFNPTGFRAGLANFTDNIPLMGGVGNFIRDDAGDRARQAELQWSDAQLKAMSGAASPEAEVARNNITFFARPGQNYGAIGERLEDARRVAFESSLRRAGPDLAGLEYPDTDPTAPPTVNDGRTVQPADSALAVAPGEYAADYVARFDRDGDNRASVEEMQAAGWQWDQGAGKWFPPNDGGQPPAPPSGPQGGGQPPQGPQGGNPNGGGSFNPTGGFAAFQRGALGQLPFSDEISAGIGSALTGQSYGDIRQGQEALAQYDRENNGAQRNLGGIAGATAGVAAGGGIVGGGRFAIGRAAAGAPRAERLARFGARAAQGGGIGAAGAGTYAAGEAEGGAGERLQAGGNALGAGFAYGAAAPFAPRAIGAAGRVVDDALGNAPSRVADAVSGFAGRQAGRIGNALGVPGSEELVNRSTGNALQPLANRVAGRLGAERVNALSPRAAGFRENAVDPTLIDAGDDGFRGMVKAAASRNTPARQQARDFADGRAEALPTRLSMQARRVVSSDNRPVDDIVQELDDARSAQARTTYAEPYAQSVQIDAETAQALSGAPGRAALTRARSVAEAFNDTTAMQEIDALAAGQTQQVSAATLDRIRQAMSGRAEKLAQNPATRAVGAGVAQRAGAVDSALDNVEGLAPARDAYRQASRQIEATEMGGRFLNANPDDFQGAMRGLSPDQLQPARAAMARNIEISARNPGAAPGVARRLYSDPELGNMGRAAMGDDMDRLSAAARAEYSAVRNASEINPRSGSQTNLNAQDEGGLMGDLGTVVRRPLSGGLSVIANRFVSRGFNDDEARQLVEMAIDPAKTDEMISLMSRYMSRREARNLARATRYQVLTTTQSGQRQPE